MYDCFFKKFCTVQIAKIFILDFSKSNLLLQQMASLGLGKGEEKQIHEFWWL